MRVYVHWNITKRLWSVKALEGPQKDLVVAQSEAVHLINVIPKVSQSGRERALRENYGNVHAGLVGELKFLHKDSQIVRGDFKRFLREIVYDGIYGVNSPQISYNPYKAGYFYSTEDVGMVFTSAEEVVMVNGEVYCQGEKFEKAVNVNQLQLEI